MDPASFSASFLLANPHAAPGPVKVVRVPPAVVRPTEEPPPAPPAMTTTSASELAEIRASLDRLSRMVSQLALSLKATEPSVRLVASSSRVADPPRPPVSTYHPPTVWMLRDSSGQSWTSINLYDLHRHVAARNAGLSAQAQAQTKTVFLYQQPTTYAASYGSGCAGGRCGR